MPRTSSDHFQGGFDDITASPRDLGKSRYRYLFETAAADKKAGLFSSAGKSEVQTVERLIAFARWLEREGSPDDADGLAFRIRLPAAYTYFGQFVNHDISAPVGGMSTDINSIGDAAIIGTEQLAGVTNVWRAGATGPILDHFQNEHEHPLHLDSLYGEGPFPTDGNPPTAEIRALFNSDGLRFKLARTIVDAQGIENNAVHPESVVHATDAPDILRGADPFTDNPTALIADRRNDENLILSQLHLAMMLFHNRAVDVLQPHFDDKAKCFAEARQLVLCHYHWCILHDFLPRILNQEILQSVIGDADLEASPEVPMEFTTAAFQFGHSMISASYDYSANFGTEGYFSDRATLGQLFSFTTRGGMHGHAQLPDHWVADWDRLTDPDRQGRSRSEKIDLSFAPPMMAAVPEHENAFASIVARNLVRGFHRRIPFGQVLARECRTRVLTADEIRSAMPRGLAENPLYPDRPGEGAARLAFLEETPAWLYFLCEAQVLERGEKLGPAGSRIVAETIVSLIRRQKQSILGPDGAGWTPMLSPIRTAAGLPVGNLRDLLLFATLPA